MSVTVTPTVQRVTVSPTAQGVTVTPTVQRVDVYPDVTLPALADTLADLVTATAALGMSAAPTDIGGGAEQLASDMDTGFGALRPALAGLATYHDGTVDAGATMLAAYARLVVSTLAEEAANAAALSAIDGSGSSGAIETDVSAIAAGAVSARDDIAADAVTVGGGATPGTLTAAHTRLAADAPAALASLNATLIRHGGVGTYTDIVAAAAALAALSGYDVAPGRLTWTRHDAYPAGRVVTAGDYTMTITAAAGETITMSAIVDTIPIAVRHWEVGLHVDAAAAFASGVAHNFCAGEVLDDAAAVHAIGTPMLHRTAGSIASSAGPPLGIISGGGIELTTGPTTYHMYAARISGTAAGASTSTGSTTSTPPGYRYIAAHSLRYRDGGSGDRLAQTPTAHQGIAAAPDSGATFLSLLRHTGTSAVVVLSSYTRSRIAVQLTNNGASDVTYTLRRVVYARGATQG